MKENPIIKNFLASFILLIFIACTQKKEKRAIALYNSYCASCHLLPKIDDLPKHIWQDGVLPDMAARMGIIDSTNDPLRRISRKEQMAIIESGIYPRTPMISEEDWSLLSEYIIAMAPDSLDTPNNKFKTEELIQFTPEPIQLDSTKGAWISFLEFDQKEKTIISADLNGNLIKYDAKKEIVVSTKKTVDALTTYIQKDTLTYLTSIGYLNPSERQRGSLDIYKDSIQQNKNSIILHRPVHTLVEDLNNDGRNEIIVSEFGNLTGSLSLFQESDAHTFEKKVLLNLPGTIRTIAKDLNGDGKTDLMALTSQGQESIVVFYQQQDLKFRKETLLRFSPVYGSSWFELIDFDGDGDDDIITVHGDNADKSYVHKPYHGLRIHINNGKNEFNEAYFYPLNGATRVNCEDYDHDGDIDFAIVATFPDYEKNPNGSFIYLENKNPKNFDFKPYSFDTSTLGRWFLLDSGDVDSDGDIDIVLSSFTYTFTPVPDNLYDTWNNSDIDIMILKNNLVP